MIEFRIILLSFILTVFIYATYLLFLINIIFGFIFLAVLIINILILLIIYFQYLFWPYHKWISTSLVNIQKVEIPSKIPGKYLKGLVIRDKKSDPKEKQIGILFHHGYASKKERYFHFIIPLALNGFTVLCYDARGHGESKKKKFNSNDFVGIMSDVKNAINFLENLDEVDGNRLIMMGHSMGAIAALSQGYQDKRLKKIVGLAASYDLLELFNKYKRKIYTVTGIFIKIIKRKITKNLTVPLEEINREMSPRYFFDRKTPIPDKDRVYLVHCKKDIQIDFEEALKIKEALKLPNENVLFLEKPERKYLNSHSFMGQATIISDFLIKVANGLKE